MFSTNLCKGPNLRIYITRSLQARNHLQRKIHHQVLNIYTAFWTSDFAELVACRSLLCWVFVNIISVLLFNPFFIISTFDHDPNLSLSSFTKWVVDDGKIYQVCFCLLITMSTLAYNNITCILLTNEITLTNFKECMRRLLEPVFTIEVLKEQ